MCLVLRFFLVYLAFVCFFFLAFLFIVICHFFITIFLLFLFIFLLPLLSFSISPFRLLHSSSSSSSFSSSMFLLLFSIPPLLHSSFSYSPLSSFSSPFPLLFFSIPPPPLPLFPSFFLFSLCSLPLPFPSHQQSSVRLAVVRSSVRLAINRSLILRLSLRTFPTLKFCSVTSKVVFHTVNLPLVNSKVALGQFF